MSGAPRSVVVWDLPTRLFHWIMAGLVAAAYATWRLGWMNVHGWVGEAALALLIFRLAWGFLGSDTARFSRFVASPRAVAQHMRFALLREPDRQVGHNPAGGWMVLLLLALIAVETLTGIYSANDVVDVGPLTELVPASIANAIDRAHALVWDFLLAAIVVHVAAIAGYAVAKGHNLVRPMITGTKNLPRAAPAPQLASRVRAGVVFVLSAAAAALIANLI
jgi:cytochrome b